MQTTEKLEKALSVVMAQFDEVNAFFIAKIAAQIQKIGQMSQSSINQLTIMMEMAQDVTAIKKKLQTATGLASAQMAKVYQAAMDDVYTDPRFAAARCDRDRARRGGRRRNVFPVPLARRQLRSFPFG